MQKDLILWGFLGFLKLRIVEEADEVPGGP
jgi:hypothetical protein